MDHDCPEKKKKSFLIQLFFFFFLAKESQQQPAKAHQADEQLLYSRRGGKSPDAFYTAVQLLFPSMNKLITPKKTRHIHLMTQLILNCSYIYCIVLDGCNIVSIYCASKWQDICRGSFGAGFSSAYQSDQPIKVNSFLPLAIRYGGFATVCHRPVGIIDARPNDIWSSVEKFYRL